MCGICGFVGFEDKGLIRKMCNIITHRGPDDSGIFIDKNVCLGMRRLSIIDVKGGHQPIHNESERVWIVFNGEIYNFLELRKGLEEKGHRFYTNSDTEAIVHLYEEYGENCVEYLRGMFAFVIWDSEKRKLFLARDRLGKKPLYYTIKNGILFFASEIKSILQYPEIKREVDFQALNDFLTFQYVPGPKTVFKGICKLQPGNYLIFKNKKIKIKKYWDINIEYKIKNERQCKEHLLNLLNESVKLRLMSEVPLGVYLSGGLDSTVVTGIMSKLREEPIKTFTVGFDHPTDEVKYAKIVSEYFDTDHHELFVKVNNVKILPEVVWHFDEPLADPAALPTYLLSKVTKKYVTVALVGEGGDETFAGYPKYNIMMSVNNYKNFIPNVFKKTLIPKISLLMSCIFPHKKVKKYLEFAAEFSPTLDNNKESFLKLSALGFNEKEKNELYNLPELKKYANKSVIDSYFKGNNVFKQMIKFDTKVWLPDRLLMKVDKMTMAHSVEARTPLLDHKLVEFANTLHPQLRLNKYIFKKSVANILPKEILKRKKHGFAVPISSWFDGELKEIATNILENLHRTEYFKYEYVQRILRNTRKLRSDHKLWNLLNFELWYKIFIENDRLHKPNLSLNDLIK